MTRRASCYSIAIHAFLAVRLQTDATLESLPALSAGQFETHPDAIIWGHVGTLNNYSAQLRGITDSAFKEGEHAA